MLESIFVALIVVAAAGYAVWALTPVSTRRNVALRSARALGGPGAPGIGGKIASVLQKLAQAPGGGCSDCPAATLTPAERAQQQQPAKKN